MNQQNPSPTNEFVELSEFKGSAESEKNVQRSGNILKNASVEAIKFQHLESDANDFIEPTITINRNGDRIESIEFVCTCGKSKVLMFEYDAE